MSPSGGVNLYSGDVAYMHPLATVKGRAGMDISLALAYSSNIYSQVHCANDRAPTGWTGLGWQLAFGSIIRDHKGTKKTADDEFIYISPTGVPNRLVKVSGIKCYVYAEDGRTFNSLPTDFSTVPLVDSCITSSIDLMQRGTYDVNFCLVFEGRMRIGNGPYTFTLTSNDGCKLYINDSLVIDHDGIHNCTSKEGTATLTGDSHFRIEYFQQTGERCLKFEYRQQGTYVQYNRELTPDQLQPITNMTEDAWDFGRYYLENDPYTRIEPIKDAGGNITRWVVTATDGKRMHYGDASPSSTDSSTRYTFAFGDYVGPGWGSTPTLFPYLWDLNKIVDVAGNTLQFTYHQQTEALKVGTWNSANLTPPLRYTKASYLKGIYTPEGKHVAFECEQKPNGEPFDPYRFEDEPDGFMEMFESERLKTIKIYSIPGSTVETGRVHFSYEQYLDPAADVKYRKSYLTRITQESNGSSSASTRFEYNNKFTVTDNNYHTGALRRVVDEKSTTVTEFTYKRQSIQTAKTSVLPADVEHTIRSTCSGVTDDGNPYVVCTGGEFENPNYIKIYNWTGSKWEKKFGWRKMGISTNDIDVFALKNHVVLRAGADDYIEILTWDGKRWYNSRSLTKYSTDPVDVIPGEGYIAFLTGAIKNKLEVLHWRDNKWVSTFPQVCVAINWDCTKWVTIHPNGQHILVSNSQNIDIYTFDGEQWRKTLDRVLVDGSNGIDVYPGCNFYAFRFGVRDRISAITWNGSAWVPTLPTRDLSMNGHDFEIMSFNNNILLRHNEDDYLQILSWTGSIWDSTFQREKIADRFEDFDFDKIGSDYISLRHGDNDNKMEILNWNASAKKWDTTFSKNSVGLTSNDVEFYPGPDYIVLRGGADSFMQVYCYNGTSWDPVITSVPLNGVEFEVATAGPAFALQGGDNRLRFYYKYQDRFDTSLSTFTVTKKKVTDPYAPGGTAITTAYDYNIATNPNFDTRAGCAKFNKVDITTAGAGKTTQYFFNDVPAQATINANYDELDGMVYKAENSNGSGVILDSSKSTYEIFQKSYWPPTVKQKRATTSSSWSNGVELRNDLLSYNQWNGLPQITRTFNSDGTQKLTKTIFAFESIHPDTTTDYPDYRKFMSGAVEYFEQPTFVVGAYMLTAPLQTVVYEKPRGATSIQPAPTEIRSAQAVTYDKELGCKAMLPWKNYVWKTAYNPDGTPVETFVNYCPYLGPNPNWQLTGSTDEYNSNGNAIQTSNATGVASVVILSHDKTLPLMTVSNAPYGRCIFTNWTENEPAPEDINIVNATMSTVATDLHFAGRTLKLTTNTSNLSGDQCVVAGKTPANTTLPALGGTSYSVQFWARGSSNCKTFMYLQALPGLVYTPAQYFDLTTSWRKYDLKMTFPAGINDKQFRLVLRPPYVPGATYTAGTILYDDVRVTPAKALSVVNYYDPVWRKPILSIDANNNPGTKVTLDELSRPVRMDKIDPSKSVGEAGFATRLQQKKYHLRSDLPVDKNIVVLSPDGGERLVGVTTVPIYINKLTPGSVTFYYKLKTGSNWSIWVVIPNSIDYDGNHSLDWKITGTIANECKIRVQCGTTDADIDSSDAAFYLSTPAAP